MRKYILFALLLTFAAATASKAFSLVQIETTSVPNGTLDTSYSAQIKANAAGCTPYTWSITSGSLPPGLSGAPASNTESFVITGTPSKAGSYSFTVQVKGCGGHISADLYTLTINGSVASGIQIETTSVPNGELDTSYSAQIKANASGCTPYTWSITSGSLPPGLSGAPASNTESFVITGTPSRAGSYSFTVQVKACGGGISADPYTLSVNGSVASGKSIPASFWGLVISRGSYPVRVPYGEFRGWDSGSQWPSLEVCEAASGNPDDPCFDWANFDSQMANVYAAGVNDVMYTMSRTPQWGVDLASDPTGLRGKDCNYYQAGSSALFDAPGQCLPPVDLNVDGSGTDQIWKNWITAVATHVNNPIYLETHARIEYWDPWNEWYRGSRVLPNYVTDNGATAPSAVSYAGTYAQMVRLTEDMRCVITGKGTIHNYPSAGKSTPCSATPIDVNALIVSPNGAAETPGPLNVLQNFLYCNGTGTSAPAPGSYCTTGNAGSQAVDVINLHLPSGTYPPETVVNTYIPNARARLQAADLSKPMINGEGSWNIPSSPGNLWSDPYAQAGFVPRFFALYWSAGLTMNMWYSYDTDSGELFNSSTGKLNQPAATSWTLTYKALVGATPIHAPFCSHSGTVYTCDFTEADGTTAELVWDAQYGHNCSQMANPVICGSTTYSVPTQFNKDWVDVGDTVHTAAGTVKIGANPILLEGN